MFHGFVREPVLNGFVKHSKRLLFRGLRSRGTSSPFDRIEQGYPAATGMWDKAGCNVFSGKR